MTKVIPAFTTMLAISTLAFSCAGRKVVESEAVNTRTEQTRNDSCAKLKLKKKTDLKLYKSENINTKKRYSFNFLDLNIKEAVLEVATTSKTPIILDENVTGVVTANISNMNIIEIMAVLTSIGPYDFIFKDNSIYIGVADQKAVSYWKLVQYFDYKTSFMNPSQLVNLLDPFMKNYITFDDTSRIIHITATGKFLKQIVTTLDLMDSPQKQILLSVTVSEIDEAGRDEIGRIFQSKSAMNLKVNPFLNLEKVQSWKTSGLPSTTLFPATQADGLLASLAALSERGLARIKSQPRIVINEGVRAQFSSSKKHLLRGVNGYIDPKIQYLESGVSLNVVPQIVNENEILLVISDSMVSTFNEEKEEIDEHKISTIVRVKDGDALVFGGMLTEGKVSSVTRVPLLSSLPLIGWFFQNRTESTATKEIVFAIKSEIICKEQKQL